MDRLRTLPRNPTSTLRVWLGSSSAFDPKVGKAKSSSTVGGRNDSP
jgi:hypothetical protein